MREYLNNPCKTLRIAVPGLIIITALVTGCYRGPNDAPQADAGSVENVQLTEGSKYDNPPPATLAEGSGKKMENHPALKEGEKIQRQVQVPDNVKGKWKAVKILVRNKKDEAKNEMKTVDLGTSFQLKGTLINVTVGPFFPNFVMDKNTYTSMNNKALNPAVQLKVEENGKILYKGWAFSRYPAMYAFEHDTYALELKDYIPVGVM